MAGSARTARKASAKSASPSPAPVAGQARSMNASVDKPVTPGSKLSWPMRRLAVDPGDKHVGWCTALDSSISAAGVCGPGEFIRMLEHWLGAEALDEVVCEVFALYPWQAAQMGFNEFETSQLIGVIKYLCMAGGPLVLPGAGTLFKTVGYVPQGADIKKGTFAQLRGRGIQPVGLDAVPSRLRQHGKDAQAHMWYRIWNS